MDAEFVSFLDTKFQTLEENLRGEIRRGDEKLAGEVAGLRETVTTLAGEVAGLRESVRELSTSIDRLAKLHEHLETEQAALKADVARIKEVLAEKLGVRW